MSSRCGLCVISLEFERMLHDTFSVATCQIYLHTHTHTHTHILHGKEKDQSLK